MKYSLPCILAFMLLPMLAVAGQPLGTKQEAKKLADQIIDIVEQGGIAAGIEALFNPDLPFSQTLMGINLFEGSILVGDNREPEMVSAEYAEVADLTGDVVWPRIDAAADRESDVVLKWYHYDTQEVYDFHCYSKHSADQRFTVMVCR